MMNEKIGSHQVIDLSVGRREMLSLNDLTWRRHCMFGLLEVDVTIPRQFIKTHRAQTGELLSFTGYLAFCLARAVDENKTVQAYLKGRKQIVVFDDVDVGLMIERQVGEKVTLMGYVLRGANHKTYQEIHLEIRSVQSKPIPPNEGMPAWFRTALLLPWPFSEWFKVLLRFSIRNDPKIFKSMAGTVGITSVGMFGKGHGGWGIVPLEHNLGLVVGSTAWKPTIVEDHIEPREILSLTLVFDHDVIDGAPAARFTRRLVKLIESGYGLNEDQTNSAIETKPARVRTE